MAKFGVIAAELARFGVSGLLNAAVYIASGQAMLMAGVPQAVAGAIALLLCSAVGYGLHRLYSFRSRNKALAEAGRYAVLVGINTVISSVGLPILIEVMRVSETAALVTMAVVLPFTNFLVMKAWIFKQRTMPAQA